MATLAQILNWFKTGLYPTEEQFAQTWQSFWHKSESIPAAKIDGGYNTATSFTDFPTDKALLLVTLSESSTVFTPHGGDTETSMTVIVKNGSANGITQTIPQNGLFDSWDGYEIIIPAGGMAEINLLKADKNYVMFKIRQV
jgi:hypothetical protein